jgi:hypothetical protein
MPGQPAVSQFGSLIGSFLVPVLADVRHSECRKPPDVFGRMELGDHDQRGQPAGAAG